jgi:hypothetical protein
MRAVLLSLLTLPLLAAEPADPPKVFRSFLPEAGPSAFAVVLTPDLALCYDPLRGGINQAWRGRLDLSPTWQAKINAPANIDGPVFYREQLVQPLRVGDPDHEPVRRFKGYRYAGDAVVFDFTLDGVAVSETLRQRKDGLERVWHLAQPGKALFFRVEAQPDARLQFRGGEEIAPGLWRTDTTLTLLIRPAR